MPRHMSFTMTRDAVLSQQKTVTRRLGWAFLRPGDLFVPVERVHVKKGKHHVVLWPLCRCVSNRPEHLDELLWYPDRGWEEVRREGFPDMAPRRFIAMFMAANRCYFDTLVNRIEFEYVHWMKMDRIEFEYEQQTKYEVEEDNGG